MAQKKRTKKKLSIEELIQETNHLLKVQLMIKLASHGIPHQTIRKILGTDMKLITDTLKPLKGKIDKGT